MLKYISKTFLIQYEFYTQGKQFLNQKSVLSYSLGLYHI